MNLQIKQRALRGIGKAYSGLRYSLRKLFGQSIVEFSDVLYFGGILSVAIGLRQYDPGLSFIVAGALLLLTVKPLLYWFK